MLQDLAEEIGGGINIYYIYRSLYLIILVVHTVNVHIV